MTALLSSYRRERYAVSQPPASGTGRVGDETHMATIPVIQKEPLLDSKATSLVREGSKGANTSPRMGTDRKSATVPELGDSVTGHSDRMSGQGQKRT
jgi:hypothetical protein